MVKEYVCGFALVNQGTHCNIDGRCIVCNIRIGE